MPNGYFPRSNAEIIAYNIWAVLTGNTELPFVPATAKMNTQLEQILYGIYTAIGGGGGGGAFLRVDGSVASTGSQTFGAGIVVNVGIATNSIESIGNSLEIGITAAGDFKVTDDAGRTMLKLDPNGREYQMGDIAGIDSSPGTKIKVDTTDDETTVVNSVGTITLEPQTGWTPDTNVTTTKGAIDADDVALDENQDQQSTLKAVLTSMGILHT